jgi:hypothetical protein
MEPHWSRSPNSGSQAKSVHPVENACEDESLTHLFHKKLPEMARAKRLEDDPSERVHRQRPRNGQRAVEQTHRRRYLCEHLDGSRFRRARRRENESDSTWYNGNTIVRASSSCAHPHSTRCSAAPTS